MNSTNYYSFHGLSVAVCANHPVVLAAIHARLRHFTEPEPATPDLSFELFCVSNVEEHLVDGPQGRARPIYESPVGEILHIDGADQLYINCEDRVRVLCDLTKGQTRMSILQSATESIWLASHLMFTIPFIELLKRRGRYSLHAACLRFNGRGLLLPGTSGAGKSTLTIALLRAGFDFLGDDMVFLTRQEALQVLAFPDEIDVSDTTVGLFPELHPLLHLSKVPGCYKRQVRAEEFYGVDFVRQCRPRVLVFPRVASAEQSILKPMHRDEALLELVPNVLLMEARSCQAHLSILAELVRECACYRLETGRDFDALGKILRELLQQSVEVHA